MFYPSTYFSFFSESKDIEALIAFFDSANMRWESLKPEEIGKGFPLSFAANIGMAKWSLGDCRIKSWDKFLSENDTDKFKHLPNRVRVEFSTEIDSDTVLISAMKDFLNSFGLPNMEVIIDRL